MSIRVIPRAEERQSVMEEGREMGILTPSICSNSDNAVELGPRNFAQRATSHSRRVENGAHSDGSFSSSPRLLA